jgi:hypothetical protein
LTLVPPEKDDSSAHSGAPTTTIRTWPALLRQFEELRLTHGFGPTQATQFLVGIAVELREALGQRWFEVLALASKEKLTVGQVLAKLLTRALDSGAGEGLSHVRRSK